MKVEILYFEDCPNYQPLLARLPALLTSAGIDADVTLSLVDSEQTAQEQRFLGSPIITAARDRTRRGRRPGDLTLTPG